MTPSYILYVSITVLRSRATHLITVVYFLSPFPAISSLLWGYLFSCGVLNVLRSVKSHSHGRGVTMRRRSIPSRSVTRNALHIWCGSFAIAVSMATRWIRRCLFVLTLKIAIVELPRRSEAMNAVVPTAALDHLVKRKCTLHDPLPWVWNSRKTTFLTSPSF